MTQKRLSCLLVFFLLCCLSCFAQEITPVSSGIVTINTGQKMSFTKLRIEDGQVVFFSTATRSEYRYFPNAIGSIEDSSGNKVYTNPILLTIAAKKDEQKALLLQEQEKATRSDGLFRAGYADGIYLTRGAFVNRTPDETPVLQPKTQRGLSQAFNLDTIPDYCFFYHRDRNERIRDAFAICYKGCLFFRAGAIVDKDNVSKGDGNQNGDDPSAFTRVVEGGDHYLYMEMDLTSDWAVAASYAGGATGAIGFAAGTLIKEENTRLKGVVWDKKEQQFNIFRNCKDFNAFVATAYPQYLRDCNAEVPFIESVRKAITVIK